MKYITDLIANKIENSVYIAGGGQYGEIVAKYLKIKGIEYDGVYDKKEKDFLGKTTITYDKIDLTGYYIVASLDYEYGIDIKKELFSRGVTPDNIYSIDKLEIIQDLFDVVYNYSDKFSPSISKYKNIYKGETCFIVGNGPSLKIEDLDKLIGKHTFAANRIYNMYLHTDWRPEFYFSQDSLMTQNILLKDIDKILDSDAIFTSVNSKMVNFSEKYNKIRYMRLFFKEDNEGLPEFSSDCEKIIFLSDTVSYSMLQMAVYMGFKTIYLLGMDCSYSYEELEDGTIIHNENVKDYGDIIGEVLEDDQKGMSGAEVYQHIKGFKSAKKYADGNDIHIYNATRGGKLEVFERVDFDSLF